jgi:hypothetical protein
VAILYAIPAPETYTALIDVRLLTFCEFASMHKMFASILASTPKRKVYEH